MRDVIFILKSFLITSIIVILLQLKVGGGTVEDHTIIWLENSLITRPLHYVVAGGVAVTRDLWFTVTGNVNTKFKDTMVSKKSLPGRRSLKFKRSVVDKKAVNESQNNK